jgi:ATP-dependent Lon protease
MPGRIVQGLTQAKVKNPLMLLDEIDKLTHDAHGDPASALLEALDAEQNHAFRDHFVELPVDLSECLFIATANTLDTVPKPLLDRMEVIELKTYTKTEKVAIAKNHLIPKQLKRHGLNRRMLVITESALEEMIDYYTRESGVRNLERRIAELARRAARRFIEESSLKSIKVNAENLSEYLGPRKLIPEHIADEDEIGIVNGLAYTESGGDVLKVEVAVLEGSGKLELTGSLGDVMKESARIALSLVRSMATEYGIDTDFYKTKDIHIHFPEGAVPKDGPSAGVTMVTALVSALSGRSVRRDVAMTGEISLRGKVLAIGGLKEKTMAAYSYGVRDVLIPEDNMRELHEIDKAAKEGLNFIPCRNISDVLRHALCTPLTAEASVADIRIEQNDPAFSHRHGAHIEIRNNA